MAGIEDSPKPPPGRVTLTYPVINKARCAIFAMAGAGKAEIVKVNYLNFSTKKIKQKANELMAVGKIENLSGCLKTRKTCRQPE